MSATSLLANASTDKPTGCARVFRYIFENPGCNYKQIASALRMPAATVTGRVNELMYDLQYIRIVTVVDNMQLYRVRAAGEPLNHRSKSPAEVLQDKLDVYIFETEIGLWQRGDTLGCKIRCRKKMKYGE